MSKLFCTEESFTLTLRGKRLLFFQYHNSNITITYFCATCSWTPYFRPKDLFHLSVVSSLSLRARKKDCFMAGSILQPSKATKKLENCFATLLENELKLRMIKSFSPPTNQTCLATNVLIYPNLCWWATDRNRMICLYILNWSCKSSRWFFFSACCVSDGRMLCQILKLPFSWIQNWLVHMSTLA